MSHCHFYSRAISLMGAQEQARQKQSPGEGAVPPTVSKAGALDVYASFLEAPLPAPL